jgi:hypothetical protein
MVEPEGRTFPFPTLGVNILPVLADVEGRTSAADAGDIKLWPSRNVFILMVSNYTYRSTYYGKQVQFTVVL